MYITFGISIRDDVYYKHMDTRYSMNYRVRVNKMSLQNNFLLVTDYNLF